MLTQEANTLTTASSKSVISDCLSKSFENPVFELAKVLFFLVCNWKKNHLS